MPDLGSLDLVQAAQSMLAQMSPEQIEELERMAQSMFGAPPDDDGGDD